MNTLKATAIVALLTATGGLATALPTLAQDTAPAQIQQHKGPDHAQRPDRDHGPRGHGRRGMQLFDFQRGPEAVEIALVRLSHRIELTDAQQPLFDTLRTDALSAAETLATTLEGLRPDRSERPDMAERLANRITIDTARLEALTAVQPSLVAFFDSLTDEQKAQLMPMRGGPRGPGAPEAPTPEAAEPTPAG